jgi:hypothetical protein
MAPPRARILAQNRLTVEIVAFRQDGIATADLSKAKLRQNDGRKRALKAHKVRS